MKQELKTNDLKNRYLLNLMDVGCRCRCEDVGTEALYVVDNDAHNVSSCKITCRAAGYNYYACTN